MKPKLSRELTIKIFQMPEYQMGAHLVTLVLRDGRKIKNVVISPCDEIWGVGSEEKMDEAALGFRIADIVDAERQPSQLPGHEDEWWKNE